MKYIKIAVMSLLAAAVFGSCTKKTVTPGPGTGVVGFTQTEVTMQETDGLTYIPIAVTGEPGGYPVTLKITAEGAENVNDVLLITSTDPYSSTTTLYIGEDANNTVNLQVAPAWRPDDNADYTITLTITDATGAAIGTLLCPGVGTLIGGALGILIGAASGAVAGNTVGKLIDENVIRGYRCGSCSYQWRV